MGSISNRKNRKLAELKKIGQHPKYVSRTIPPGYDFTFPKKEKFNEKTQAV